jgi:hypothetical protein
MTKPSEQFAELVVLADSLSSADRADLLMLIELADRQQAIIKEFRNCKAGLYLSTYKMSRHLTELREWRERFLPMIELTPEEDKVVPMTRVR